MGFLRPLLFFSLSYHIYHCSTSQEVDGTATWSLSLLKANLRQARDGLSHMSTYTIWRMLHEAGYHWQKSRTWCETGIVKRKRKRGVVTVRDPDAVAKKNSSSVPIQGGRAWGLLSGMRMKPDPIKPCPTPVRAGGWK